MSYLRMIIRLRIFVFLLVFMVGCGSTVEQQESSYKWKMEKIHEMENQSESSLKEEIKQRRLQIEDKYQKIPQDKKERETPLGELNKEMTHFLSDYQKRVELSVAEKDKALNEQKEIEKKKRISEWVGEWKGGEITLLIDGQGKFEHKKQSGDGNVTFSKSVQGEIVAIDDSQIRVKASFIEVRYRIDQKPFFENGEKKVKLEGEVLTLVH